MSAERANLSKKRNERSGAPDLPTHPATSPLGFLCSTLTSRTGTARGGTFTDEHTVGS